VAAPAGSLTINIGDLLARWTNDRWNATPHRVAMPRSRNTHTKQVPAVAATTLAPTEAAAPTGVAASIHTKQVPAAAVAAAAAATTTSTTGVAAPPPFTTSSSPTKLAPPAAESTALPLAAATPGVTAAVQAIPPPSHTAADSANGGRVNANGRQRGTPPRLSIVYFTGPHPETLITPLPTPKCGGVGRHAPVTAAEHVMLKIKAATV